MNYNAIDKGAEGLIEVPVDPAWADLPVEELKPAEECCSCGCGHENQKLSYS